MVCKADKRLFPGVTREDMCACRNYQVRAARADVLDGLLKQQTAEARAQRSRADTCQGASRQIAETGTQALNKWDNANRMNAVLIERQRGPSAWRIGAGAVCGTSTVLTTVNVARAGDLVTTITGAALSVVSCVAVVVLD